MRIERGEQAGNFLISTSRNQQVKIDGDAIFRDEVPASIASAVRLFHAGLLLPDTDLSVSILQPTDFCDHLFSNQSIISGEGIHHGE